MSILVTVAVHFLGGAPPDRLARRLYAWVTGLMLYSVVMTGIVFQGLSTACASELAALESLRWERRVILVFVTPMHRESALAALWNREVALEERDVTWLVIQEGAKMVSSPDFEAVERLVETLVDGFQPLSEPFDVILIGKDGGVKARTSRLDLDALLEQIDGMPMRRREIGDRAAASAEEVGQ